MFVLDRVEEDKSFLTLSDLLALPKGTMIKFLPYQDDIRWITRQEFEKLQSSLKG